MFVYPKFIGEVYIQSFDIVDFGFNLLNVGDIILQRRGNRAYVTRTINVVKDMLQNYDGTSKSRLSSYRKSLNEKIETLMKFDIEILATLKEDEDIEGEIIQSSEIKDDIQDIIFQIDDKLSMEEQSLASHGSHSSLISSESRSSHAKLPKLTLKSFDGNPIEFQSFWDSFNAAVNDTGLEKIAKFNYLKSYLKGQALQSISGLTLTADNYDEALNILKRRYGNKQLLISKNIENLLNITPVHSIGDIKRIRSVHDEIEVYARNLQSLDVDKSKYGQMLVSIVMSKIPNEIKLVVTK